MIDFSHLLYRPVWVQEAALEALNQIEKEYDGQGMCEGGRECIFMYLMLVAAAKHDGDWTLVKRADQVIRETYESVRDILERTPHDQPSWDKRRLSSS